MTFKEIKKRALSALKKNFWKYLLLMIISGFLCVVISSIGQGIGSLISGLIFPAASLDAPETLGSSAESLRNFMTTIQNPMFWLAVIVSFILTLVISLVSNVITVGRFGAEIKMLKGEPFKISGLFAYFSKNPVNIMIATFLSSLFTVLLCAAGAIVGGIIVLALYTVTESTGITIAALVIAYILFIVYAVHIVVRFMYTPYVLASDPDKKPMEAIKESLALTKGKVGRTFLFMLSFFGWVALIYIIAFILLIMSSGMFTSEAAEAIMIPIIFVLIIASLLVFLLYFMLSMTSYYLDLKGEDLTPAPEEAAAPEIEITDETENIFEKE